jgi:hypothetical protein
MKITSHTIKAAVASYWRYTRQCGIVAFESRTHFHWGGELADILVVTSTGPIVIEVKTSLSDFKRDRFKMCHKFLSGADHASVREFFFAVPQDLANEISLLCGQLYPYAGVLGCNGPHDYNVEVHRKAKRFECSPLKPEQVQDITRSQTATLCRLAVKVAEQADTEKRLRAELKEYRQKQRLEKEG